jgi:hypothetical protein
MRQLVLLGSYLAATLRRGTPQAGSALLVRDPAQGLVEYGLILLMIMVVCIAIVALIGHDVSQVWYQRVLDSWPS